MTQADFDKMMDDYLERRGDKPASGWAGTLLQEAKQAGITDGSRPQSFATREEVAAMVVNASRDGLSCSKKLEGNFEFPSSFVPLLQQLPLKIFQL